MLESNLVKISLNRTQVYWLKKELDELLYNQDQKDLYPYLEDLYHNIREGSDAIQ